MAVTTATTPLLMGLAFTPVARQVVDPAADLQFSVLVVAGSDGPAAMLRM